jgi:phytoene dehydrogenase-like protein
MYDVVIIGAGMSGLAAGIRLAMFDRRVCILERHYAIGGLNSYYRLDGRNFDVGLHALTNFSPRGAKQGPLARLLRQLRLSWDDFELAEQCGSSIVFPGKRLRFNNNPALFEAEIAAAFPQQRDEYRAMLGQLLDYDQLVSPTASVSARKLLTDIVHNPLLVEMLLCPVMFYGGAQEHDIDWGSFSVLFRAIFLEGLARPRGGIRVILKHLVKRFKQLGGELKLRAGVSRIVGNGSRAQAVLLDDGTEIAAGHVLSSAGWNETLRLSQDSADRPPSDATVTPAGKMTFIESISVLDRLPRDLNLDDTIVFYNDRERFDYSRPQDFADLHSGLVCSPNNYRYDTATTTRDAGKIDPAEGMIRVTALANFDRWAALSPDEYGNQKKRWYESMLVSAVRFVPDFRPHIVAHDMFTPTTIVHYTGHDCGAVYGAPQKRYDARTPLENVLVCGADQGYVGIIGTLTSGIQVANQLLRTV